MGFERDLARAARTLAAPRLRPLGDDYAQPLVEHELGLVLAQLDRLRMLHRDADARFVDAECDIGTELLQMDAVRWWYLDSREERWRDRQRLKARRAALHLERLRSGVALEQQVRALEDRLLTLVHRHGAVSSTRGDDRPSAASRR